MGTVFLAHDAHRNRRVAIKIPKFANGRESIERFEREARVMANLRHPNICPFYHSGELCGTRFFAMQYIEGETLAERLAEGSPLSGRRVAMLVRKLACALDTAHLAGVTHRDLKPANIMIRPTGEPVIMDFGLAKLQNSGSMITKDGKLLGTPAYMSPEQVKGRCRLVGPASDIYSLGTMMYEMLAGRIPFAGKLADVLHQIVSDAPPPPSQFNTGLDRQLEAICLRAMAKSINNRFPSAVALANALRDC
jgi:serine/threonine-protein kinase